MLKTKIESAILLATEAHAGQTDKGGYPYILHPIRVMLAMKSDEAKIVAVLHDVIEDTPVKIADIKEAGYSEEVIAGLLAMTHKHNEPYFDYIDRVNDNDLAREVKLADLTDNMDISRLPGLPTEHDLKRTKKYRHAERILMGNI
jgi:guanosine-3',5'-bis(diphosphate) 3'-pyrophosphohydrolase